MSSATMRAIAISFLTGVEIPGLSVVKKTWDNQMQLIGMGGTVPTQTLAALHVTDERDVRVSVPAVAGQTMVYYDLELQICIVLDGSGDDIIDAADQLVEAIKARLRSDPRMGQTPDAVFESAQATPINIHVKRGDVQFLNTALANGTPVQWVNIAWTASEMITA